jgi:hypothetical protein
MKYILPALACYCSCFAGEDPKLGASREEVVRLLGEPNGRLELKNGGAIYSYKRGDVTFDKNKAIKIDLASEKEVQESMEAERLRKASIDAKNAPGGEAFIEKKRQLRDFLLTEFHISKTVGNPIREFVHKGSAYHAFSQYAPNGPRGLTISVQVNSEGNLALLAKYLGFTDADYNQLGVSFGESDLLTQPTRDMTRSPVAQSDEKIIVAIFSGQAVEDFIQKVAAEPNKKVTFSTFKNGRPVDPNIHPGQRVNNPTIYTLTEADKKCIRRSVELSECLRALGGDGASGR